MSVRRERELERKLEIALKALRFYGDPYTWCRVSADAKHCSMLTDFNFNHMYGELARVALKAIDPSWEPNNPFKEFKV